MNRKNKIDPQGGFLTGNIASLEQSQSIGLCVKESSSGKILFQNPACKKICGEHLGDVCSVACSEECMRESQPRSSHGLSEKGTQYFKSLNLHESFCDVMIVNDELVDYIFIYNLDQQQQKDIEYFKQFELTKREFEIVELVLKGFSNKQITEKLFIAKSTLKSHINNIYKKIPEELVKRMR